MDDRKKQTGISGFTIVRNAEILEYPFRESVLSALPLCDEFFINCGDSSDNTLEICQSLEKLSSKVKLVQSVWDFHKQSGGWQLKAQTDTTMSYCGENWCLYIQADEVLHEADYDKIRHAIRAADAREEVDGILFDYCHFYGDYAHQISGRNWYRREVRAVKNHRGISAFRDAQGFRKDGKRLKVLRSGAKVFHYGYVRSPESMRKKSAEMAKWWGKEPETDLRAMEWRRHVGLRPFTGSHPSVMRGRIANASSSFDPRKCQRKWDKNEIKNALTLLWESVFPFRIGEFRNYELVR